MFPISWIIDIDSASESSTHTAIVHSAIKLTPDISQFHYQVWTFVPTNSQKCVSGAYDIQNVLVLVSRCPYSREHALRQIYALNTLVTDHG